MMNLDTIEAALRLVDRQVWIVTAADGPRRGGLVATWVMQGSLDPDQPLLVAALAPTHYTTELVEASGAFAAHLIAREHLEHVWRFALGSGRTRDKLAGVPLRPSTAGSPILAECLAWFDCRVVSRYSIGDRTFFYADVVAGEQASPGLPLFESQVLASASPEQLAALGASRRADIEILRPLAEAWRGAVKLE